jgi:hypothetical protein
MIDFCRQGQRKCRRRDEDAYYQAFAADPPALLSALGRALSFGAWRTRKADGRLLLADEELPAVGSA